MLHAHVDALLHDPGAHLCECMSRCQISMQGLTSDQQAFRWPQEDGLVSMLPDSACMSCNPISMDAKQVTYRRSRLSLLMSKSIS